jgi:hypothetical protein
MRPIERGPGFRGATYTLVLRRPAA